MLGVVEPAVVRGATEPGAADQGHVLGRDHPLVGPGLARGDLDAQPQLEHVVLRPHGLHLGQGVALDHPEALPAAPYSLRVRFYEFHNWTEGLKRRCGYVVLTAVPEQPPAGEHEVCPGCGARVAPRTVSNENCLHSCCLCVIKRRAFAHAPRRVAIGPAPWIIVPKRPLRRVFFTCCDCDDGNVAKTVGVEQRLDVEVHAG